MGIPVAGSDEARFCCWYLAIVYVEEPSYDRTLTVLRRARVRVVGFPLEDDGPDVEAVDAWLKCGERSVLSRQKRQRIAELSQEYEFWIIEDIPYRKLRYRGEDLATLFDLAPDRVIQMSSYSKLISLGLRVGYAIVPELLAGRVAKVAEDT
jgi:2-aminoadipate transaminase